MLRPAQALAGLCLFAAAALAGAVHAQEAAPDPEAILKQFTVVDDGTGRKPLPKIGVVPSLASNIEDVTIHNVVRKDLDLCGEFEVIDDDDAPDGLYLASSPVDVDAWKEKGAEAVVKITGKQLDDGTVELKGLAYLVDEGTEPVYDKTITVAADRVRFESHRVADALIGALTGTNGGFSSQMTFVYGVGKQRRVYIIDADGHDPHAISPDDRLAMATDFGKDHKLYYTASKKKGAFKLYSEDDDKAPIKLNPRGSIYGLAFNKDASEVAVAIAQGSTINLFRGPDVFNLTSASKIGMTLQPAWSPTGKLAFSGEGKWGQRIYVDNKPISPEGLGASGPTFCRHPEGIRIVYMVGVGKNTDLVVSGETGGGAARLTAGQGRNMYPACSPDGRLVAFFSTRGSGAGLYIMRLDGTRPKRISTLVGDALHWTRFPEAKPKADKSDKKDEEKKDK
jgi:TolB protein